MSHSYSINSSFFEQLAEHVFISEILQEVWVSFEQPVEILRAEVDGSGYDLVLECNNIIRHVQLKTSQHTSKTQKQKIHTALSKKPGGCVVWLIRHPHVEPGRIQLKYRYFGSEAGNMLPSLSKYKTAKHTKGNKDGKKQERPNIMDIPKANFKKLNQLTS